MPKLALAVGAALTILAIAFYLGTGMGSWTALIPAIPGVLILILGWVALAKPDARKHAMHAALVVALLAVAAGAGRAAMGAFDAEPTDLSAALWEQILMAAIGAAFGVAGIFSFVRARRADVPPPDDRAR